MKKPAGTLGSGKSASRTARGMATALLLIGMGTVLSACQFQPLYSSDQGTVGTQNLALSRFSVAEVNDRVSQQVRNHLIFLINGGSSPIDPSHEVRLRVTSSTTNIASGIRNTGDIAQVGNTAGSVTVSASYEVYDFATKEIVYRGTRNASAAFDQTSQSFASERAERDAENRAAREVAEQLRLALGGDLSRV